MAEEKLDLLDIDDEIDLPDLPDTDPFQTARPKRPWLLFGAALIVVILATYIIIRIVASGHSGDTVEIDLNIAPGQPVAEQQAAPIAPESPQQGFAAGADSVISGQVDVQAAPVRVVEERKEVVFKPDAPTVQPPKPRPVEEEKPAAKPAAPVAKPKPAAKAQTQTVSNFYVQFGSYGTRAAAESAQKKIRSSHSSLFEGKQFVILAAVLPNGSTTYRLRVGFPDSGDANGFCKNAKSDGLDCYVAK